MGSVKNWSGSRGRGLRPTVWFAGRKSFWPPLTGNPTRRSRGGSGSPIPPSAIGATNGSIRVGFQLSTDPPFVGKVRDDELGRTFAHDIRAARVAFDTKPATTGPSTARCYIMVTPDGERTMNTYLGAAQDLTSADIDEAAVASAGVIYLEGYLWDPPKAKEAFLKAAGIAHKHGRRVALTLSDAFCVDRYRSEFLDLIKRGTVDILFANEHELRSLYQTADFDTGVKALQKDAKLAVVTRSERGCMVVARNALEAVQAMPVGQVVDVTGAGDLFAAGFLVGLSHGKDHRTAARLGSLAAAEVIQHVGARPAVSLKALAAENGLAL